ncbi:MAG: CBS domain-containing protein [Pyrinomonadaceae bacterium]
MARIPENLSLIAEKAHADGQSHSETVRTLLSWFGAQRRGYHVVRQVRSALRQAKLVTVPDFEVAYIDGLVEIKSSPPELPIEVVSSVSANLESVKVAAESAPSPFVIGGSVPNPVPRIGMLEAANTAPVSVTRDSEVCEAVTLMLMHDFSQLPVMQNERDVDGIISWKSIGATRALNRECQYVRQCMEKRVEVLKFDTPLFTAVGVIAIKEVVLVRNEEKKITGLVTTSDISLQFGALSEPFLLLGEIENHIRRLIDGKYSLEVLSSVRDPSDSEREIENVADLTFGEYVRLLENPSNWDCLGYDLSRNRFINQLNEVRRVRNEVMHFHPDGVSDDDLDLLRDNVRFMQAL